MTGKSVSFQHSYAATTPRYLCTLQKHGLTAGMQQVVLLMLDRLWQGGISINSVLPCQPYTRHLQRGETQSGLHLKRAFKVMHALSSAEYQYFPATTCISWCKLQIKEQ